MAQALITAMAIVASGFLVLAFTAQFGTMFVAQGDRCAFCHRSRAGRWLCTRCVERTNRYYLRECRECGTRRHDLERCRCGAPPLFGNVMEAGFWRRLTWMETSQLALIAFAIFHLFFTMAARLI
jgi:hypothetical protein